MLRLRAFFFCLDYDTNLKHRYKGLELGPDIQQFWEKLQL